MKKRFDNLGRLCIPKYIREDLALDENSFPSVEYDKDKKQITLKKTEQTCDTCGADAELLHVGNICLCKSCLRRLNDQTQKRTA